MGFLAFLSLLSLSEVGLCGSATLHLHRIQRRMLLPTPTDERIHIRSAPNQVSAWQPNHGPTVVGVPVADDGITGVCGVLGASSSSGVEKGILQDPYIRGL